MSARPRPVAHLLGTALLAVVLGACAAPTLVRPAAGVAATPDPYVAPLPAEPTVAPVVEVATRSPSRSRRPSPHPNRSCRR